MPLNQYVKVKEVKVKGHKRSRSKSRVKGQDQYSCKRKGRWAHANVKLLYLYIVSVFGRAVHSLSKIGEELYIEPLEHGVSLFKFISNSFTYYNYKYHKLSRYGYPKMLWIKFMGTQDLKVKQEVLPFLKIE